MRITFARRIYFLSRLHFLLLSFVSEFNPEMSLFTHLNFFSLFFRTKKLHFKNLSGAF